MLCQKCHKNLASVRYAEVVDGKVTDLQLCQECLTDQQENVQTGFELSEPPPFVRRSKTSTLSKPELTTETCKTCSMDLKSIVDSGKVGCSSCYDTFAVQLESLLEGLHTALAHHGKVPHLDDARARIRSNLQAKRALMKTALNMENYEDAAALRDEIRALEVGLGASEAGAD